MRLGDQLPMLMRIELYFYRNPYLDLLLMKPLPLVFFPLLYLFMEDLPIETHIVTFVALSTSAACSTATYAPAYAFVYGTFAISRYGA